MVEAAGVEPGSGAMNYLIDGVGQFDDGLLRYRSGDVIAFRTGARGWSKLDFNHYLTG